MEAELRELLEELVRETGAEFAAIGSAIDQLAISTGADVDPSDLLLVAALGMGARLQVRFARPGDRDARAAAIERAARALRGCARRWQVSSFPELRASRRRPIARERVIDRIVAYLQAFANAQGVVNTALTVQRELIASARPLDEQQLARLPLLLRQVEAETRARKGKTSHVDLIHEDLCAFSFWIDACLVAYCAGDYSPDFLRHRARMVAREISQLLPHLEEPPNAPASVAPIPE